MSTLHPDRSSRIDALGALATPLRTRDPRTQVVTVPYCPVAPLLSPSQLDRQLAEPSTAI